MANFSLTELEDIIAARAGEAAEVSYTASLMQQGINKAAEKLGEEAIETVIAAIAGDKTQLTNEACDLLYHLLVVLRLGNVSLDDIYAELQRRTAQSGLEEKASR